MAARISGDLSVKGPGALGSSQVIGLGNRAGGSIVLNAMRPALRIAILALTLLGLVSATVAEARKARPVSHGKKPAVVATTTAKPAKSVKPAKAAAAKPLKITPNTKAASPRGRAVPSKTAASAKIAKGTKAAAPTRRAAGMSKKTAASKAATRHKAGTRTAFRGQRHAISRAGRARHLRQAAIVASRSVEPPARVPAAPLISLSETQKTSIYNAIVEQPLRPRSIVTERMPPVAAKATPTPTTVGAAPSATPAAAASVVEPAIGKPVADSVKLYLMPQRAIAAAPHIERYRYAFVGERVLLVDPVTSIVVADVSP